MVSQGNHEIRVAMKRVQKLTGMTGPHLHLAGTTRVAAGRGQLAAAGMVSDRGGSPRVLTEGESCLRPVPQEIPFPVAQVLLSPLGPVSQQPVDAVEISQLQGALGAAHLSLIQQMP